MKRSRWWMPPRDTLSRSLARHGMPATLAGFVRRVSAWNQLTIALLARCGSPASFHPLANQAWVNFDSVMATVQANGAALEQASQAPDAQRFQAIAQAAGLIDFFAARGISRDQAMQCLADTAKAQQIVTASQTQSDELGVTGTPTFFLNGQLIELTRDPVWPQIEAALQNAGAR